MCVAHKHVLMHGISVLFACFLFFLWIGRSGCR